MHMDTLSSTLTDDTLHAVRAEVVLLANDPLHTPHIQQREGLTEHKKEGLPPIVTTGMVEYRGVQGARKQWITWRWQ